MTRKASPDGAGSRPRPHYHGHRQRLRERFLKSDPDSLPDYEVLELLLFQASPRGDVKPLAKALMARFGDFAGVLAASPDELRAVGGVGDAALSALKCVHVAAARLARARLSEAPVLSSWERLIDYCRIAMGHARTEEFRLLFLDRRNRLLHDEVHQRGTVDHTPVYPREVVKRALDLRACALILVHNHPSGDPTPSRADIDMTRRICDAGRAVGITVHDHIIVGRGGHNSFKAMGLL